MCPCVYVCSNSQTQPVIYNAISLLESLFNIRLLYKKYPYDLRVYQMILLRIKINNNIRGSLLYKILLLAITTHSDHTV